MFKLLPITLALLTSVSSVKGYQLKDEEPELKPITLSAHMERNLDFIADVLGDEEGYYHYIIEDWVYQSSDTTTIPFFDEESHSITLESVREVKDSMYLFSAVGDYMFNNLHGENMFDTYRGLLDHFLPIDYELRCLLDYLSLDDTSDVNLFNIINTADTIYESLFSTISEMLIEDEDHDKTVAFFKTVRDDIIFWSDMYDIKGDGLANYYNRFESSYLSFYCVFLAGGPLEVSYSEYYDKYLPMLNTYIDDELARKSSLKDVMGYTFEEFEEAYNLEDEDAKNEFAEGYFDNSIYMFFRYFVTIDRALNEYKHDSNVFNSLNNFIGMMSYKFLDFFENFKEGYLLEALAYINDMSDCIDNFVNNIQVDFTPKLEGEDFETYISYLKIDKFIASKEYKEGIEDAMTKLSDASHSLSEAINNPDKYKTYQALREYIDEYSDLLDELELRLDGYHDIVGDRDELVEFLLYVLSMLRAELDELETRAQELKEQEEQAAKDKKQRETITFVVVFSILALLIIAGLIILLVLKKKKDKEEPETKQAE